MSALSNSRYVQQFLPTGVAYSSMAFSFSIQSKLFNVYAFVRNQSLGLKHSVIVDVTEVRDVHCHL